MKDYELLELENGIRIVHRQVNHIKIAHIGIMLDIGSRDESPEQQGLAHFWEHMAFKGTKKRKAYHIINRLESLGGELNAYTTKEKICFYAAVLSNHLDKAIEIICDITFNSVFAEKQIEKERMVILEEMAMYRDTPEDALQDELDELIFKNHSLGMNILGTEETVSSFKQLDFKNFLDKNVNTRKIIISSVGNYSFKKLVKLVKKHIQQIPVKNHTSERQKYSGYIPLHLTKNRHITQTHYALGIPAYKLNHPNRIPFFMLSNILGGPALNSRLNLTLREKYGFVYGVEASYAPYVDTGLFSISFATDPRNVKKSINLVLKEINNLKSKKLGQLQLHKAKQQIKGQLAMSEENNNGMMLMMAKSLLDLQKIPIIDSIFKVIDEISAGDLISVANDAWDINQMSSLTFLPEQS